MYVYAGAIKGVAMTHHFATLPGHICVFEKRFISKRVDCAPDGACNRQSIVTDQVSIQITHEVHISTRSANLGSESKGIARRSFSNYSVGRPFSCIAFLAGPPSTCLWFSAMRMKQLAVIFAVTLTMTLFPALSAIGVDTSINCEHAAYSAPRS